ncbi:Ig-like domain-containing protein [uncultured Methanobrevibacter sp.]|uniref:Ig-like domain-containing protein n=1 Tax=uncultured Methanobrevibacter sp. TaxID=253161 RepID=UPI0025D642BF|nr:Ig-like domain-containing protein [uncultured Methanobrevibacter sp.]
MENGIGVLNSNFNPGDYDADVNYLGNDKYNPSSTSTSFTVKEETKKDSKVIATPTVNGESVSIRVVVSDKDNDDDSSGISGMVTIEIGNAKYAVELENGIGVLNSNFNPGDYEADINYLGNNEYNPSSTSTSFTVTNKTKMDAKVTAVPSVNGKTVTINIAVSSDGASAVPSGNVTVGVSGQNFLLPLDNGNAVFTYDFFPGIYNGLVTYYGDDNFNMASTDVSFTVNEISTELKNTTIGVTASSVDNNVTITASVNPMASGLIEFNIEGNAVYIAINNGKAVYKTNLPAGDYEVTVTYMGDSNFNGNSTSTDFTVSDHVKQNTPIEYDVVSSEYGANITVTVNERATGFIEFTLNGNSIYAKVDKGKAKWNTMLLPGNYVVTATYLGDDEFNSNTTDIPITIYDNSLKDTTITADVSVVENNITITVDVDSAATGLVRFDIAGPETYTVYTEIKNGQTVLYDTLKTGNYTAVITYMGDENFNPNSTELEFTVVGHVKKDTPITANATVNGDMVTIDVNVDLNATGYVTFSIMGKTLIAEISKGKATLTDFYASETYQVDVEYLGDENYNANSTTVSFTVIETDSELKNTTINVDVVSNENNVKITAQVDSHATGLIEFNIAGQAVYIPVNNGIATYETILTAGDYNVTATYLGDERFNPNRTSKEFTVTDHIKKNTTIVADVDVDGYDVTITVSVDSNATGFVKLVNGENTINIEIADGKAT